MPLVCQKCGHRDNWDTVPIQKTSTTALYPSTLASHRAALAEIQAEIAHFKMYSARYISALENQLQEVEAKLKVVVYPVLSLPPEITSRIFVECLPGDDVSPLPAHAPLLLTLVCRRWKDIALSTCQLWSSLRIESFLCEELLVPRGTSLRMQTWFSRARERPLSLIIRNAYGVKARDLEPLDISSIVHTLFPDLDLKDVLENAPLITKLRCSLGSREILDFRGPTSNTLTILHIFSHDLSPLEFISILRNFPSLSDLACSVQPGGNDHHTPSTFPNISILRLYSDSDEIPPIHVLELLTLPNLGSLQCRLPLNAGVILPLLSRSACVLREFKCEFHQEDSTNISEILGILPSVETLDIFIAEIDNILWAIDPQNKGSKLILPRLRHLKIRCLRHLRSSDYRSIVDIVHGRHAHPDTAELKSLRIINEDDDNGHNLGECPNCPSDADAAELRSLTASGFDLNVDTSFRLRSEDWA
ncbi:F-box domain-containing protein [Mycena sanguinolenta]|uniref:F-box domain-containing protein n=1 Tax=Mycena sanguinolenta TaxID=230812 RepID=A0A8H6XB02_9AGAR|nr:F-box domain-containing protein [Mycena sanguinolenta]